MNITPVQSVLPSQPLSSQLVPRQNVPAVTTASSVLSIQNGSASTSNIATLSFLQGLVGYASAQAILNATVSYQQTSVYGRGLSPQALSISDQISELYRQIAANQTSLVDQLEADADAAAKALAEGDIWGFLSSALDTISSAAKLIGNSILGFVKMITGVISIFFISCFSSWFRAGQDAQSALFIGGTNDPNNVMLEGQALRGLISGLDPVKDLPKDYAAVNKTGTERAISRDPDNAVKPDNDPVISTTEAPSDSTETIPGWLPGYVSPDQILEENDVKQSLLQGLRETKEALVSFTRNRSAASEALDLSSDAYALHNGNAVRDGNALMQVQKQGVDQAIEAIEAQLMSTQPHAALADPLRTPSNFNESRHNEARAAEASMKRTPVDAPSHRDASRNLPLPAPKKDALQRPMGTP